MKRAYKQCATGQLEEAATNSRWNMEMRAMSKKKRNLTAYHEKTRTL